MTTSAQQQRPTAQRLAIILAVLRWHADGQTRAGLCADCGGGIASGAPRITVHGYVSRPPEQLVRLSLVAPGTHAESAQVDTWLRSVMRLQQRSRRQSPIVSRSVCWSCAVGMLTSYLGNATGALTSVLAALAPDQWTALAMCAEPGYGRTLERLAISGQGKTPPLADLLRGLANI